MSKINGTIIGYDPGGNNSNGFALLRIQDNVATEIEIKTLDTAESILSQISNEDVIGLGVDTLSCWCTGDSGWRPADIWLRKKYPEVRNSVMSPNTLSGSMGRNGMSVLIEVLKNKRNLILSETHPKVLYYALTKIKYDYKSNYLNMDLFLSKEIGIPIKTNNDHEWDAVISAYALLNGISGKWTRDLHQLPVINGRIVNPCGKTAYYWPDDSFYNP
ncbi:hypothetical protein J0667_19750 [Methylomonas sp. WH-1]|uniref:hypothetical protein n=1 Tax=unclassified Methylomonas TaxID=2608980 RepID=UPI00101F7BE2|nr:hypothetical protein [Methylomonas sp. LW13]